MQKVFSTGKNVGGVFPRQDSALRFVLVCGFLDANLLRFVSDATMLIDMNTIPAAEVGA